MARHTVWLFAALLAFGTTAVAEERHCVQGDQQKPAAAAKDNKPADHPPDRAKWWKYDRAELGITDQQSAQIDQIFESEIPKIRAMRKDIDKLEESLSDTIKAHAVDVATLGQQIDKVDKLRNEYSKTRTLMLYRIHLVLSAEQRTKLKALRERREAERRKDEAERRKDDDHRR